MLLRSLSRDNKHAVEKEQVLKLIRKLVEFGSLQRPPSAGVGSGSVPLSEPIMRALIAVAEHTEDQFKHLSLLTLAEIRQCPTPSILSVVPIQLTLFGITLVMVDIDLVSRSGGLRCLLQAMADGPAEVAPILTMAFLCIIDAPRTRAYLKPGLDLEVSKFSPERR
jgi:rapamycin-insensitive companion of mTOR